MQHHMPERILMRCVATGGCGTGAGRRLAQSAVSSRSEAGCPICTARGCCHGGPDLCQHRCPECSCRQNGWRSATHSHLHPSLGYDPGQHSLASVTSRCSPAGPAPEQCEAVIGTIECPPGASQHAACMLALRIYMAVLTAGFTY